MKFLKLFCILACMYGHMMHAVFVRCAELVNDEKKKVILCGDAHFFAFASIINEKCSVQAVRNVYNAYLEQQKIVECGISHLLHDLRTKVNIITETNDHYFFNLIEKESQKKADNDDTMWMVARYLLRSIMQPKQKNEAGNVQISGNYHNGFPIHENLSWVVGDQRDVQEMLIACDIPVLLPKFKKCWDIGNGNDFLTQDQNKLFEAIRIGFVKKYILSLKAILRKNDFYDEYGYKVLAILDAITKKSGLSESSHFVDFYDYFSKYDRQECRAFMSDMSRFICQKFDLELRDHCDAFMKPDNNCDTTIIVAGFWHTKYVQEYLLSKGFRLVDESSKSPQTHEEVESELFLKSAPDRIERCNKLFNELIFAL